MRSFVESLTDFTEENRYNLVESQSEIFDKIYFYEDILQKTMVDV